jgi:hypothetical protein
MQIHLQYSQWGRSLAQRLQAAVRCWYFKGDWLPADGRMPEFCPETWEYFSAMQYDEYTFYGHLGRLREDQPFFTSHRRGYSYFDDYQAGKKGYFAFDRATLWRVDSILPDTPLVFVLKKFNLKTMEDYKAGNTISVTGSGNIVTAGSGNQIHIGHMNVGGNLDYLKVQLAGLKVPLEDIEEIAAIVQQERPGADGALPPKAQSWLNKMVHKAATGIWEVVAHTAGHLLAGYIKGYYHLPG